MKYLLLGGAGFVGTHLAKHLLREGHDVTIIDSLVTSNAPDYDVKFIHADVCVFPELEDYIASTDIVYYLAGSVGVAHIDKHPKETLNNNIGLMNRLIPLFEKYQKRVIFTSTSEVYGEGPFSEHNNLSIGPPTKLRWAYAAAKLMTEFSIAAGSFPYVIFRLFNVVGPGQLGDYGMVLPRFVNAAKNNEDLTVYGNGQQIRSFCHVSDAVEYMRRLENTNSEIFNLGTDDPITIYDLADRVIKLSHSESKINYVPYEDAFSKHHGDISSRIPDLEKLKRHSNYIPMNNLNDIIKSML
jgi:UDP-glucose 4-epimerase